jgi:UDP-2,4-diacetamido-2,4,6-trideoxy-beta-L-altropyranose hydrolase
VENPEILIRADADASIGSGHVMRMLTLANGLLELGYIPHFLCAALPEALAERISQTGCRIQILPRVSRDEEIRQFAAVARETEAVLSIIDHYGYSREDEIKYKQLSGQFLICVDDTFEQHHCNIVFNQNLYASPHLYRSLVPDDCLVLAGFQHALLRGEFQAISARPRSQPLRLAEVKILVTLGGSDEFNQTGKVLDSLRRVNRFTPSIQVVTGSANPNLHLLRKQLHQFPFPCLLGVDAGNMAERMNWADLVVSAGGTTTLELLALKVPSITIPIASNQELVARTMQESGLSTVIHEPSVEDCLVAIEQLVIDEKKREAMLSALFALPSPQSPRKTATEMLKACLSPLTLRDATMEDLLEVHSLSNDPAVRQHSFRTQSIPLEEHQVWFARQLEDPNTRFYVIHTAQRLFAGQVRFNRSRNSARWIISISLAVGTRGLGFSAELLQAACGKLHSENEQAEIVAYVSTDNIYSLKSFRSAGFKEGSIVVEQGMECHELTYLKENDNEL